MKNTILRISFALLSIAAFGQSASLMPVPRQTFGVCNSALAGGHVYTYAAGTTTPMATFVDYLGVIQNANPIVLDVCGRAAAYLGGNDYKIVVTDANNVQQYTQDHVSNNIFAGSINSLAYNLNGHPLASSDLADGTTVPHYDPTSGSFNPQISWGARLATAFPGSDIGAQVNAAIASFPGVFCGEVYIPVGIYSQSTMIVKPRCVKIRGASASSTILNWVGSTSGWAVNVSDSLTAVSNGGFPEGAIEDLTLNGSGTGAGGNGVFLGGDPTSLIAPPANHADHENLNRVRIMNFNIGVLVANNAWSDTIHESLVFQNGTGLKAVSGGSNFGERIVVFNSSIQNNSHYAIDSNGWFAPGWSVKLIGSSIDYNGDGVIAPIQGGFISESSHFEQSTGPFFDTTSASPGWIHDSGSLFVETGAATTCFGKIGVGALSQPNSFVGSSFYTVNANTDLFCDATGTTISQPTANLLGVSILGTAVNTRGANYYFKSMGYGEGQFGSEERSGVGYCEAGSGITTLALGGTATTTAVTCLPAGAVIDAVVYRITTTITTAVSFTVGDSGSATRYCGTQSVMTAGTTGVCTAAGAYTNASALGVKVTTNANPGAGAIRFIVYYHTFTGPTS